MVSFKDAQLKHARCFARRLREIETTFQQGTKSLQAAAQEMHRDLLQIQKGQAWSAAHLTENLEAARLCSEYAAPTGESMAGCSLLAARIHPTLKAEWVAAAISGTEQLNDRHSQAVHTSALGQIYIDAHEMQTGIALLETALEMFTSENHQSDVAIVNNVLGIKQMQLGDLDLANKYLSEGLRIAREINDLRQEANALHGLGELSKLRDNAEAAQTYLESALQAYRGLGDPESEASALTTLASYFHGVGAKDQARHHFSLALKAMQNPFVSSQLSSQTSTLVKIGLHYAALGDPEGIKLIEAELGRFREVGNRNGEGSSLVCLGVAAARHGNYVTAIERYNEALPLFLEDENWIGVGVACDSLGRAYLAINEKEFALTLFERAAQMFEIAGVPRSEARAHWEAAKVLWKLQRGAEAILKGETALEVFVQCKDSTVVKVQESLEEWRHELSKR